MGPGTRPGRISRGIRAALIVVSLVLPSLAGAHDEHAGEEQLKAAYLFNFAKFVEWPVPAGPDRAFVIGIAGDDGFARIVEDLVRGKMVRHRAIAVRRVRLEDDPRTCDVLFMAAALHRSALDLLHRTEGGSVLTVGDTPDFFRHGGVIRMFVSGDRMRFQINVSVAERAGLRISSQLLSLADQ